MNRKNKPEAWSGPELSDFNSEEAPLVPGATAELEKKQGELAVAVRDSHGEIISWENIEAMQDAETAHVASMDALRRPENQGVLTDEDVTHVYDKRFPRPFGQTRLRKRGSRERIIALPHKYLNIFPQLEAWDSDPSRWIVRTYTGTQAPDAVQGLVVIEKNPDGSEGKNIFSTIDPEILSVISNMYALGLNPFSRVELAAYLSSLAAPEIEE